MRRFCLIDIILILLSVMLTRLAFPPYNFYLLAFAGMIPFFYVLCRTEKYSSVWVYGQIFGFCFYLSIYGPGLILSNYVPFPLVLILGLVLVFFQGLFISAAVLLGKLIQKNPVFSGFPASLMTILAYAFSWIILDWLRSLGMSGLTLGGLAYSQYLFTVFIQLARYTGPYGLTFIIVFLNVSGGLFLAGLGSFTRREYRNWLIYTLFLTAFFTLTFYVMNVMLLLSPRTGEDALIFTTHYERKRVTVYQPNVPQNDKLYAETASLKRMYLSDIRAFSQEQETDLLVLPETIVPEFLLQNRNFMFALRDALDFSLVFGTPRSEERKGLLYLYNSVVLLNRYGVSTILHDKKYLVPFGEYLPLRWLFWGLFRHTGYFDAVFTPGAKNQPTANYAVSLCFESFFPYQAREQIRSGGRLLLIVTNDAWFGNTSLLDMHLSAAVLRAVENSRYAVQAANTGRSAIIDYRGRILQLSAIDTKQWLTDTVEMRTDRTLYTYCGEVSIYAGLVFFCLYGYLFLFLRNKQS